MPISRSQLVKELEPGLNALFGLEYARYENQHEAIYDVETSDRAFEEEVMLSGFGSAQVKPEGTSVNNEISINACSSEVSFKSEAVDNSFLMLPPVDGCAVEHSSTPSPPVKDESNALFNTLAAFTCLVLLIERASAFV